MAKPRTAPKRTTERTPAHDTPTMGPRHRPRKVRPARAAEPGGHDYQPGAKPPARNPWVDEGDPEVNG